MNTYRGRVDGAKVLMRPDHPYRSLFICAYTVELMVAHPVMYPITLSTEPGNGAPKSRVQLPCSRFFIQFSSGTPHDREAAAPEYLELYRKYMSFTHDSER